MDATRILDGMVMWARFRKWKHGLIPLFVIVVLVLMRRFPEGSSAWYAGAGIAAALGLAYVIEEVMWNLKGDGRACPRCGHVLRPRSFKVYTNCPGCGETL